MYIVVGLGNPGKQYEKTRHNVGFKAVDFLNSEADWQENKRGKFIFQKSTLNGQAVIFVKPQTFMNNSGIAIKSAQQYFKVKNDKLVVIHDEIDLPFGTLRVRPKGSSAGHNGIKSIIGHLKTEEFWRLRIGIKNDQRTKMPADKFVLQKFSREETSILREKIFPAIQQATEKIIRTGPQNH